MNQIEMIDIWGCNLIHKAPKSEARKIKTKCNRTIINQYGTVEIHLNWAKANGRLCKRCFS